MTQLETLCARKVLKGIREDPNLENSEYIDRKYDTYLGIINHMRREEIPINIKVFDLVNKVYGQYLKELNKQNE